MLFVSHNSLFTVQLYSTQRQVYAIVPFISVLRIILTTKVKLIAYKAKCYRKANGMWYTFLLSTGISGNSNTTGFSFAKCADLTP